VDTQPRRRVTIERLVSTYLVPHDHPAADAVRSRLDALAREHLVEACRRLFDEVLATDDPSVWLIDRVEVDLMLDVAAAAEDRIAEVWGRHIAAGVFKTISGGEDGTRVLRFPDRAAYLARFLADLIRGAAWDKWYYRSFETLRILPVHAAAREALVREPEHAEAALSLFDVQHRLGSLLALLTATDLRLILDCCASPDAVTLPALNAALSRWRAPGPSTPDAALAAARHSLGLYLDARRNFPAIAPGSLRAAAEHLASFAGILRAPSGGAVLDRIRAGDLGGAVRAAGTAGFMDQAVSLLVLPLHAAGPQWLEVAAAALTRPAPAAMAPRTFEIVLTPEFGGVFLLLPSWIDLDLDDLDEAGAFRYLVLLKCLGRGNAPLARHDPGLLLASGLEEAPPLAVLESIDPSPIAAALAEIDLPELGPAESEYYTLREPMPGFLRNEPLDRVSSLAAHALMRRFARRFLTSHDSSAAYLCRNLLLGATEIRIGDARIEVRLSPRPLDIVLRIAGIHGETSEPPWLQGRPVCLILAED
jgi:hypothetical protein